MDDMHEQESAGELVTGMAKDAKHLGDQYLALARIEIASTLNALTRILTKVLIGSGLVVVGVLFFGIAVGFAASEWTELPNWLGFVLIALVVLGIGSASIASIWLLPRLGAEPSETQVRS
jgi:hypothetical protein